MAAIIRDSFRVKTLKNFIDSLATNSLYLGIARPQYWDTVGSLDTTVPVPENTTTSLTEDWVDMLSMKKLTISDAAFGLFKEEWRANTKYDIYRHDWNGDIAAVYNGLSTSVTNPTSLSEVKCYVINAQYDIYVCLKQPIVNGVVQPSLYSPETGGTIGTNTGIRKTADGYYWKYIASTSAADIVKFSTEYYTPVKTLTATAPAPYDNQWLNQGYSANLYAGGIYMIKVLTNGTGYNGSGAGTRTVTNAETDAQFRVIGDGTGLEYTITYGSGGSITDVEIYNPGSGYTHATITAGVNGGSGATFEVIFTPMTGLGADPVKDLVGRYLLLDTSLVNDEGAGDFTVTNEYRKLLLIYNPTNYGTTTVATNSTLDATITLIMSAGGSGDYPVDAVVTGSNSLAKGRVVDFNTSTKALRIIRTTDENNNNVGANNNFVTSEALTSVPGTGTATIVSITNPEVKKYSGDVIYSEYRGPVLRNIAQTEKISVVCKF